MFRSVIVNDKINNDSNSTLALNVAGPLIFARLPILLSFKSNATRVSRLSRDNPRTFVQEAADWIEYVHRHKGAKHLKSQVYNLYWYQYYLLDLLVFLLTVIFAFCFAIRMLFRLLWKIVTRNGKGDKTSKQE